MSTIFPVECKCSVCGAVNTYHEIGSTNAFGSPDLDLRPPEMRRSTMPYWIQKCPACGYVSGRVSDPSGVTESWLKAERYLNCDGICFRSELAKRFYQYYMISMEDGNAGNAFYAARNAAWACDDARDSGNAVACRKLALARIGEVIRAREEDRETLRLVRADLLRRAMLYDQLIGEYSSVHFSEDLLNRILAFEIKKAREGDPECYRVDQTDE